MKQKEKQIAENLVNAFNALPDEKKEYLIGFAEGVAAATEKKSAADSAN